MVYPTVCFTLQHACIRTAYADRLCDLQLLNCLLAQLLVCNGFSLAVEADGQEACAHPVVVIGKSLNRWTPGGRYTPDGFTSGSYDGAFAAYATAAAIAQHCPHLKVTLVLDEAVSTLANITTIAH
jgi:hypothetical protein